MNEYEVRFVYELVNVVTIVIAEDDEQAELFAESVLYNAGIVLKDDPYEIVKTKTGSYN
jgi:hypothetical protein